MRNLRYILETLQKNTHQNRKQIMISPDVFAVTSGAHPIEPHTLRHHLRHGSYSILSAANPNGVQLSNGENKSRMNMLRADLRRHGAIWHEAEGVFEKTPEPSIMVHHTEGVTPKLLEDLGAKYGQLSVLHSTNDKHQYKFVTGPDAGKYHPGEGHVSDPKRRVDELRFHTNVGGARFHDYINFGKLKKSLKRHFLIHTDDGHCLEVKHNIDHTRLH